MQDADNSKPNYLNGIPYKVVETARIAELMARTYFKTYMKEGSKFLELDEFTIICHLLESENLSQSDMSKLLYKGKAHVGKILKEMEEKGYIERVANMNNNIMVKHTVITELGMKMFEATNNEFSKLGSSVISEFKPEEVKTFHAFLDKFQENILKQFKIYF